MKMRFLVSLVLVLGVGVGRLAVGGPPACVDENGDSNGDNALDLSDAVYLLGHLFQGGPVPVLFCAPVGPKGAGCADENSDNNGDDARDLSDAVYLLGHLFQGGPAPVPKCAVTTEICDSGIDDDTDGFTDCDDTDCETFPACGDPSTVPATGQTLCYKPIGATDPVDPFDCADDTLPCFGQDGSYQAGCPNDANRFVDNLDGTISDTCTGLMWQKDTADIGRDGDPLLPDGVVDEFDQRTWSEALSYSEDLTFATHDDWRLPNIRELFSILDLGETHPQIETAVFGVLQQRYWSSTSVNSDPASAWYVTFVLNDRTTTLREGDLHRVLKIVPDDPQPRPTTYHVRAVRGTPQILPATGQTDCYDENGATITCAQTGTSPGQDGFYAAQGVGCPNDATRFDDNLDGTLTDTCTNLVWQQDTADVSGDGLITDATGIDRKRQCQAVAYCQDLMLGNQEDWRLPNIFELHSIVDYGRSDPSMNALFGGWGDHNYKNFGAPEYWSSSICGGPGCIKPEADNEAGQGFVVAFGCCHEDTAAPPDGREDGGVVRFRNYGRQVYLRAVRGGGL